MRQRLGGVEFATGGDEPLGVVFFEIEDTVVQGDEEGMGALGGSAYEEDFSLAYDKARDVGEQQAKATCVAGE